MSLYSVDNIKEKLVISLYAKGMSVSDIEEEMREIYEIELSTSAISIITNKVNQAAQEWQNRRLCKLNCVMLYSHSISSVGERPAPRGGTTRPDERKITII